MFLKRLKLTNFRNFSKLDLNLGRVTLLIGDNAQGKSNLLESIYFLATTKSPRANEDSELIREGEQFNRVEGEVGDEGPTRLEIAMQIDPEAAALGYSGIKKKVKVNGVPRRVIDYLGHFVAVYFSPEDINLVAGPPALRRWHIDLTLAQVDRPYKMALTSYHIAVSSRNRLLKKVKEGLAKVSELDFWTTTMLESGKTVAEKRRNFFKDLKQNHLPEFDFVYHESVLSEERLEKYLPKEIAASVSLIGPHRDDFVFELNGKSLSHFGSRGEQRTAVLQLKMSELEFIKGLKGAMPILLLDDVFSELDDIHRHFVTAMINGQQTIISAVEKTQVPKEFLDQVKLVKVES